MALVVKDRVKETTTTTGTGTYTLDGAVQGFQSFGVIGDGNTTYYAVTNGNDWEVGVGTYTASGTTLARTSILESSNAGSAVNWSAGPKDIFVTYPAERAVYLSAAGSAVDVLDIGTLGAGTINVTTANITAGVVTIAPTSDTDLVNKLYVDNLVAAGIHFHTPVRVESPTALTVTYNNGTAGVGATLTNAGAQAALVIDGVTVSVNDRVLIYTQADQTQNGIYTVTNVGSGSTNWVLTRATDADSYVIDSPNGLSEGSTVFVQQGDTGAGETYTCNTAGTITFGTTNITFAQISSAQIYSAGTGLTLSGTQFSLSNTGTAGTYGSASQVPVFVTNAQGQVTSVTNTSIAIPGSAITSGTVAIANGGTGQATAQLAINALAGAVTSGQYLRGNGTNVVMSAIQAADVPTLNQNTTGTAANVSGVVAILNGGTGATTNTNARTNLGATTLGSNLFTITNPSAITFPRFNADNSVSSLSAADFRTAIGAGTGSGTVTSVGGTGTVNGITLTGTVTSSGNLTLGGTLSGVSLSTQVTGTLPVANGGTGATSLTANNVILGNGTSAVQLVAPGSSGNVLTSNGTTWTSAAPSGGTITIDNKTGAYTVISSDNGKVINGTNGSFTVSLTAASSLGAGFNCWIWNTSGNIGDAVTIDPNGAETIDGATTLVLRPGEGTQIICTGSNWQTGDKKTMRGYAENHTAVTSRPTASGSGSMALGQSRATGSSTEFFVIIL
jgi:hypothetical protein